MNLLIRADAAPEIGMGHVMHCLALTQAWREYGGWEFWLLHGIPDGSSYWQGVKDKIQQTLGPVPLDVTLEGPVDWLLMDGYTFGVEDHRNGLRSEAKHLLVIDDNCHLPEYQADIILNHNAHAESLRSEYEKAAPGVKLLLGLRYVLLRQEFWPYREWRREIPNIATKILLTFGGSDMAQKAIQVVHESFKRRHLNRLEIRESDGKTPMSELMAWADMAVCPGSVTAVECAFMGLPTIMLNIAENQVLNANALTEAGIGIYLGNVDSVDVESIGSSVDSLLHDCVQRERMSQVGRSFVDGKGAQRIVEEMIYIAK